MAASFVGISIWKKIAASKADKVEATYEENEAVDYEAKDGTYQSAVNGCEKGSATMSKMVTNARSWLHQTIVGKRRLLKNKMITGALAVRRQMSAAARFLFNFATKGSATMSKMITNARSWLLQTIVGKKRLLKNKMRILLLTKRLLRLKGSIWNTNT